MYRAKTYLLSEQWKKQGGSGPASEGARKLQKVFVEARRGQ
jgi:hypothetical protein